MRDGRKPPTAADGCAVAVSDVEQQPSRPCHPLPLAAYNTGSTMTRTVITGARARLCRSVFAAPDLRHNDSPQPILAPTLSPAAAADLPTNMGALAPTSSCQCGGVQLGLDARPRRLELTRKEENRGCE